MPWNVFFLPHTSLVIWLGIEFQVEIIFFRNTEGLSHSVLACSIAGEGCTSFLVGDVLRGGVCSG